MSKRELLKKSKITNYYKYVKKQDKYRQNKNPLSPQHPAMMCIVASTGLGKSNLVQNLLMTPKLMMQFDRFYLFARFPDEPLYQLLRDQCQKVKEKNEIPEDIIMWSNSLEDMPELEDLERNNQDGLQSVFIFDDMMLSDKKQMDKIKQFYTMARHLNTSCIFVAQHNSDIPRLIRMNCHYMFLMYVDNLTEQNLLAADYAGGGLDKKAWRRMFVDYTEPIPGEEVRSSLCIDMLAAAASENKYRMNIDIPIDITPYKKMTKEASTGDEPLPSSL